MFGSTLALQLPILDEQKEMQSQLNPKESGSVSDFLFEIESFT